MAQRELVAKLGKGAAVGKIQMFQLDGGNLALVGQYGKARGVGNLRLVD